MRQNGTTVDEAVAYKVSASVAENSSSDPMAAAAAIWTAHPQSTEAIAETCEIGGLGG